MSTRHPQEDGSEEMAWPRAKDADTAPTEAEHDSPEEKDTSAHSPDLENALRGRTPHARPLGDDEDEDPEGGDEGISEEQQERLAELEAARIERFHLQREADPILVLMGLGAVSIGLTPVDAVVRYVILWVLISAAGLVAYTLGRQIEENQQTTLEDLMSGLGFGLGVGVPLLIVLGTPLASVSARMFDIPGVPQRLMDTWVFMAVVFVQPTADSLFFRGAMQQFRSFFLTALLATGWMIVLFFPHMNLRDFMGLAITIGSFFAFLNFLYSYVRFRNGLVASWLCQIVSGSLIWFFPRLLFG